MLAHLSPQLVLVKIREREIVPCPRSLSSSKIREREILVLVLAHLSATQVLGKIREREMSARHAYELLVQDLKNQQQNKEEQIAMLQEQQAKATAVGKQAEADLAGAQESLKADQGELTETKSGCSK